MQQIPAVPYVVEHGRPAHYLSTRLNELLGLPDDRPFLHEDWIAAIHADDRATVGEAWRQHLESGRACDEEYRMVSRDGTVRWFHDRAIAIWDEGAGGGRSHGVLLDITERRTTAEALRRASARAWRCWRRCCAPRLRRGPRSRPTCTTTRSR